MPKSTARHRMPAALALTVAALGAFLLFTALGVGSSTRTPPPAPYTLTPFATYSAAAPHVGSKLLFNSAQGLVSGASATPPSALPPVPPAAFERPTALQLRWNIDGATIQQRLNAEPMIDYITPVGGGYFFAPPGARGGEDWVGAGLFAAV